MRQSLMITIAACAPLAAACAHRAVKPPPADATLAAQGIECHKERATGSLVEAKVCTSAADRARQAADAQRTKDWLNSPKAGPCAPTGPCN